MPTPGECLRVARASHAIAWCRRSDDVSREFTAQVEELKKSRPNESDRLAQYDDLVAFFEKMAAGLSTLADALEHDPRKDASGGVVCRVGALKTQRGCSGSILTSACSLGHNCTDVPLILGTQMLRFGSKEFVIRRRIMRRGVLIADFVEPTFHSWNLPAAIVTNLISLLSSVRRKVISKPSASGNAR
jgi:hypothetical protein